MAAIEHCWRSHETGWLPPVLPRPACRPGQFVNLVSIQIPTRARVCLGREYIWATSPVPRRITSRWSAFRATSSLQPSSIAIPRNRGCQCGLRRAIGEIHHHPTGSSTGQREERRATRCSRFAVARCCISGSGTGDRAIFRPSGAWSRIAVRHDENHSAGSGWCCRRAGRERVNIPVSSYSVSGILRADSVR